ncbi:MAG: sodium:proton antiporter [Chlorobi bacterium]|nr:sodium:proton antiporter [Chlorobiota bacterium]
MFILMVVIFIVGYTMIALEHPLKIDKAASALLMGTVLWALYALNGQEILNLGYSRAWLHFSELNPLSKTAEGVREFIVHHDVMDHLANISTILFFLLGAMTIVEIVDQHDGFKIITDKITTTNKTKLMWIVSFLTFFMSAVLDNLTTTIVIIALLRKLIDDKQTRWFFAAMVVVAANAGGAFSPIGDVTTIMLWIGGQITTANIIMKLFLPSLFTMIIPLLVLSLTLKGKVTRPKVIPNGENEYQTTHKEQIVMLIMGVSALLFVPVFKTVTHLPPYLGMLFGLSVIWITTEIMHRKTKTQFEGNFKLSVNTILTRVDVPTIFFFLGILTAVAALESAGHLDLMANSLKNWGLGVYPVAIIIGLLSSVVDNVPLVAASMGMYPIDPFHVQFMQDGIFWELIAYTAGTGGSILIIGSAAGVAAMGMEKIDFIWYMKRISLLAALGFFAGAGTYYVQEMFMQESLHAKIIPFDTIPKTAKDKVTADFSDYTVKDVEKYFKGRKNELVGYVVEAKKDGKDYDIRFKKDGTFMEIVDDVPSPNDLK